MSICPCTLTTPCREQCTCAKPFMSGGCDRCCSYGNEEQQKAQAEAIALLFNRVGELESALEKILRSQPCHDGGGGLFYPHFDDEGNEIGIENVDPLSVIQVMAGIAQDALSRKEQK